MLTGLASIGVGFVVCFAKCGRPSRKLYYMNICKYYVYWTVQHLDSWIKRDQIDVTWFLLIYLMLIMFRVLIHPSSGACDLFVELFHGLYCSGTMCVGVTLWFGWGGVVSGCRLKRVPEQYIPWNNSTNKSKHLRMDVLTSETCWALNKVMKKQVKSSWSLFIQIRKYVCF
jgi:hypothetical protein